MVVKPPGYRWYVQHADANRTEGSGTSGESPYPDRRFAWPLRVAQQPGPAVGSLMALDASGTLRSKTARRSRRAYRPNPTDDDGRPWPISKVAIMSATGNYK